MPVNKIQMECYEAWIVVIFWSTIFDKNDFSDCKKKKLAAKTDTVASDQITWIDELPYVYRKELFTKLLWDFLCKFVVQIDFCYFGCQFWYILWLFLEKEFQNSNFLCFWFGSWALVIHSVHVLTSSSVLCNRCTFFTMNAVL